MCAHHALVDKHFVVCMIKQLKRAFLLTELCSAGVCSEQLLQTTASNSPVDKNPIIPTL
jgi:hypothetical protein